MIMADKLPIATILNVNVVSMDEVPDAYEKFSNAAAHKFIIDVGGIIDKRGSIGKFGESISTSSALSSSATL